jgi:hypothetical protein
MGSLAQVFGGREGLGRGWVAGGSGGSRGAMCVCHLAIAVGRAGYARVPELVGRTGSRLGEEILLASWLQTGHGPVVGRGPGRRRARRSRVGQGRGG